MHARGAHAEPVHLRDGAAPRLARRRGGRRCGAAGGAAIALAPAIEPGSDTAKQRLRDATDDAIARRVFGVPTIEVDGRQFWGFDALPMLRQALQGDPWFDGPAWDAAAALPEAARRRS